MNWDLLAEFLFAVVAGITIGVMFVKIKDRRINRGWMKYFSSRKLVNEIMQTSLEEMGADRFIILEARNGGRLPKAYSKFFVSIVDEKRSVAAEFGGYEQIAASFQMQRPDFPYGEMLAELLEKKKLKIYTDDLPPGMLRTAYEAYEVKFAYVFLIAVRGFHILYGSYMFGPYSQPEKVNAAARWNIIRATASRLGRVYG